MRVLIVEDEADLAAAVCKPLEEKAFACDVAADGELALFSVESWDYDAIGLDLMLPRVDGWTILRTLRKSKSTPLLILTARDALPDKLRGLNSGADDYLTKPFELDELIARLRALIRLAAGKPSPTLERDNISIDTASESVKKGGRAVELSPKE
jgi:two-component system OmpR family response regulator